MKQLLETVNKVNESLILFNERLEQVEDRTIKIEEKLSKEKGLVELPKALLEISLEIPSEGLETSWMGQKPERTFPVSGDYAIEEAMGTYTQNNGRVSFVTADGKTYVTPFCFSTQEKPNTFSTKGPFIPV